MNFEDVAAELESDRGVRWMWWVIGIVFALSLAACLAKGADRPADPVVRNASRFSGFGEIAFRVQPTEGKGLPATTEFCAIHAPTAETRARGLMEQRDLGGYDGMIFEYEQDVSAQFYMKNTLIPLSIAWFRADGSFVSTTDMEPCTTQENCPLYAAKSPYRYALEVPKGGLGRLGIGPDSVLEVGGRCSPSG